LLVAGAADDDVITLGAAEDLIADTTDQRIVQRLAGQGGVSVESSLIDGLGQGNLLCCEPIMRS